MRVFRVAVRNAEVTKGLSTHQTKPSARTNRRNDESFHSVGDRRRPGAAARAVPRVRVHELEREEWLRRFAELIDGLPDGTLLSLYDCHI